MATAKATAAIEQLDAARCGGNWAEVPALVKQVEKRAPGKSCLALTASTEYAIHLKTTTSSNFNTPESRKYLSDLLPPLVKEVSKYSLPLPKLPSPAGGGQRADVTPEDIFQAKVTIAWIHFCIGEHHTVLDKLPGDEETPKLTGAEVLGYEYTRVALIKAIVLRGLALEFTQGDDLATALQVYKATTRIPAPAIGLYSEWRIWTEKALGRFALVAHKCWVEDEERARQQRMRAYSRASGDDELEDDEVGVAVGPTVDDYTVLFAFRSYHKHINAIHGTPSTAVKDIERGQVYRQYLRFLSALLSANFTARFAPTRRPSRATMRSYPSSLAGGVRNSSIGVVGGGLVGGIGITKDELKDEIRSIQGIYESYFMQSVGFPKADGVHVEVLEWVDLVMANWRRMGASGEYAASVIEILYRACEKTFHSPRILRHLFHTLTAVGNFKEALLSLNTYIDLVGKAKERIAKGGVEKDFDDDQTIILTIEEGIRMLCKYLNNGKRAMEIAELLEEWLEEWGVVSSEEEAAESTALHRSEEEISTISVVKPEVLCAAWRGIGVATSHWARQTVDAAKRPEIQQGAEDAFRKGLGYDGEDVDCLFGLAMVLAETRHIDDAVAIIKQALVGLSHLKSEGEELAQEPEEEEAVAREYRRLAVPFWHLLSLLLSASEEFEAALRVCDAVFEELGGEDNLRMAQTDAVDQGDPLRDMIMKMRPDEKENILEVKMTQMALVELMEGPDAAINMSDELLKLYNTLFYSNNLEEQIIKVQQAKVQQVQEQFKGLEVEDKPSRLRPISRYSKFGRSHHKKQDSSAVSVMAGNNSRPTTSGSGTSRPKSSHTPKIEITDPNGAGMAKSSTGSPSADGKLQKRVGRANSVSGGTIRRRKSLGSVKSTTSSRGGSEREPTPQVPAIQTDMKKVRRSPSLGSAAASGAGGGGNPPVPPLPTAAGPQTPSRTHIFHMHKGVKAPNAFNGVQQQTDTITVSVEDASHTTAGQALGSPTEPTSRTILPRTNRLFTLVTRTPEPVLAEQSERDKFLACLRRIWLFIAALYRRRGFFDEALQAIDEAAKIKTVNETGEADILTERGYLVLEQGKKDEALVFFETVLGWDWDHPGGIVGLCRVVLEEGGEEKEGKVITPIATGSQVGVGLQRNTVVLGPRRESIYPTPAQSSLLLKSGMFPPPTTSVNITTTAVGDSLTTPSNVNPPPPPTTTSSTSTSYDKGDLARTIARNRAYGLLSQLTKSGRGWDCSEAWFALARSYEEDGMVEKAIGVYWWCVGLEDTRPVRGWGGVGDGGGGSGRGWGARVL
ncbi:hypothetical protein L211DRAFT_866231 [Terfezia boudieri ATCC MYA-4762]|uniref:Uncharacterized protein n=1 Tax=Terfezia boudieri ATCC MYA-4762 TaxID=1051890 RepID=A0A3N4LYU8_9PEZI|nr:hypothetical protein L211DRAFT_866231 [Terfezia boudieri ATCC MYA-4762]